MSVMQCYLGEWYPDGHAFACGGDRLIFEHRIGAQRHLMDGEKQVKRTIRMVGTSG